MTIRSATLAVATATVVFAVGPVAVRSDEPTDKPKEVNLKALLEDPERPPTNWVTLRTPKAEVVLGDNGDRLRVHWQITYTGKRWPLVILEPSVGRETYRQTRLSLIAQGKSGKAYEFVWTGIPRAVVEERAPREWFLEIPKEKGKAEGDLAVELKWAKNAFLKYYPVEFDKNNAPAMYIRLFHRPGDRGLDWDLDAWTGPLMGPVTKVTAKGW